MDETKQLIEIGLGDGEGERYTLAIIFKETEEVAGFIRIYDISKKNRTCENESVVGKKWKNAEKEELYAEAINNIASYILENTEFKKEAVLHKRIINEETGKKSNKIIYSIFK